MVKSQIHVIQTAKDTNDRLTAKDNMCFNNYGEANLPVIQVDAEKTFQKMEGFGGAFTEASAINFYKMSASKREEILKAYFDRDEGIGYNLCRTTINSSDFGISSYSYDEVYNDFALKHFSIERDKSAMIPLIKEAVAASGNRMRLFASPWSPPAWMKSNGTMVRGGSLKDDCREVWARFFAKYIKVYKEEGINIWGVTIQNEPEAVQEWDSCIYSHTGERDFIKYHLGPVLEEEGLADIKIMIWDHNKDHVYDRAKVVLSDHEAEKYVWGIAFHWYSGEQFENLALTHDHFPDKVLIASEACIAKNQYSPWEIGEKYAHYISGDINNWAAGWVDWNLLLNEEGGPRYVSVPCESPVVADAVDDTVHYLSSYYYIGHFSKYVRTGSYRIGVSSDTSYLETNAFKNPDGEIVVVVLNRSEKDIRFRLSDGTNKAEGLSLSHSIMTLLYRRMMTDQDQPGMTGG